MSYARRAAPRDPGEHLTTPASRTDDEPAQAIAGRIEHIHQISDALVTDVLERSRGALQVHRPVTMLLSELGCVAADRRDFTHPDATEWTAAPVSDTETRRGPGRTPRW
ncbi:hypothetical protein [Rhodococcus rhodochrous]|uniref:Uncharacterized protein n=1 Tax=Rhodococcus rhodochrous KG-21 TaxID=1441923 RepID=A0A0N0S0K2_RHORH|nr:hypothetical protein [Rhodococcus rhodochrous]KOS54651.1 hypothetical protein Z051_18900 [Rhodococcus rhodochrous KG-21]